LSSPLTKHSLRCSHHRCGSACFQYFASDRIHHRRSPDFRLSNGRASAAAMAPLARYL